MESIDALADAINDFKGGIVLVSHDMRLIGQVAKEIWICDHKKVEPYKGDIQAFKMDMRSQMDLQGEQKGSLRGDASEKVKEETEKEKAFKAAKKAAAKEAAKKKESSISVAPSIAKSSPEKNAGSSFAMETLKKAMPDAGGAPAAAPAPASGGGYMPPHLRNKESGDSGTAASSGANVGGRYVPPHLRK
mmetsp:Transcript_24392/g.70194  ORF Transcript_24392/g.70194 Transcript_24392/m.70194 type:complete len:190 (-) Transcript_24392:253-822(-)